MTISSSLASRRLPVRLARHGAELFAALALAAILGAGCASPEPDRDVGAVEDTGLTEGGIIRQDTGIRLDATASDAAADVGAAACEGTCDPRRGGSCADGSCVLIASEPSCSGDPGTLGEGMACDSVLSCAPGLACFRAARTSGGVCAPICCLGEPTSCGALARCGGDGVLVDGTETTWGRCVLPRTCDVLAPELTCEAREGCYVVDPSGATECRLAGSAAAGEACIEAQDCAPGLFCGGIGERTCLRVCAIAAPRTCTSEERCVAQTYSPEGTGICVVDTAAR